jgi:hypothetical protein
MIDDCPASESDDFPYPDSEHEGNDGSSDCDEYMEAPIRSRRVSNSSLWGAAEDVLTPAASAASSSSTATSPVNFFKDGICMKRLFDDVMVDKSSDSGLASSSSQIPMPTASYEGIETWHPNKVFVAVVEFAAPRWSVIITKHTKVIGEVPS